VDVRVIAASNRDVKREIENGRFREDLYYRLNAVTIHLPPLRERREDIMPLANSFAEHVGSANSAASFSSEAQDLLERYPWPGNIRELQNAVVRGVALCSGLVRPEDLPEHIRDYQGAAVESGVVTDAVEPEKWRTLAEMEGDYVKRVLDHTRGNKQAAVRLLDIDRKTIERMIKRHDISIEHNIEVK
jgi:DNA-binding NtrC family response regulator